MIATQIEQKIQDNFPVTHLELLNESHMHAGPAQDSHFKLVLVSDAFRELARVKRHQAVYRVLAAELAGPVHALALHLFTPEEWAQGTGKVEPSPDCENKRQ